VVLAAFAAAASYAALNKGPWLDEFWSYYLTEPGLDFTSLLRDRWLRDTHPVPANMLYLIVRGLGAEDPGPARLLLNLPALAGMAAAAVLFFRAATRRRSFYLLFPALVLALPDATLFVSEFRSYFWQVAVFVVALQQLHFSFSEADREVARLRPLQVIGQGAVLLSLLLHFITSALITPVYMLAALALLREGRRAAAKRLAISVVLAWAILVPLVLIQYLSGANDLDVRWITTNTPQALWMFAESFIAVAKGAAVPIALLAILGFLGLRRSKAEHGSPASGMPASFAVLIVRAMLIGAIGLLILNALQPILVSRYFLPWQVMLVAAVLRLGRIRARAPAAAVRADGSLEPRGDWLASNRASGAAPLARGRRSRVRAGRGLSRNSRLRNQPLAVHSAAQLKDRRAGKPGRGACLSFACRRSGNERRCAGPSLAGDNHPAGFLSDPDLGPALHRRIRRLGA
jgi:hypothetical protein